MAGYTVGIELEFVAVYKRTAPRPMLNPGEAPTLEHFPARVAIHNVLSQVAGLPLNECTAHGLHSSPAGWTVKGDNSVTIRNEEAYRLPEGWSSEAVEITSRVLDFSSDWQGELWNVLWTLQNTFNKRDSNFWLYTNSTCGLHVHVGHGNAGFDMAAVKRFYMVVSTFERLIDIVHSVSRIGNERFCRPPSAYLYPAARSKKLTPNKPSTWLGLIAKYRSPEHIPGGHVAAYNMGNLAAHAEAARGGPSRPGAAHLPPKTIEFRQHRGSLNFHEITAWVAFAVQLIYYAEATDDTRVGYLCRTSGEDHRFCALDLMEAIGVPQPTRDYYASRMNSLAEYNDTMALLNSAELAGHPLLPLLTVVGSANNDDKNWRKVNQRIADRIERKAYGDFGPLTARLCQDARRVT